MRTLIKTGDNYGLCNRLFPFANLIAASLEYGYRIRHAAFDEFTDYFEGTAGQAVPEFPRGNYCPWGGARGFRLRSKILRKLHLETSVSLGSSEIMDLGSPEFQKSLTRTTTQLNGLYYFDPVAFTKHQREVREFFRLVEPLRSQVEHTVQICREKGDFLIGVHIRHGDYETFANGMMFYSIEQYASLMQLTMDLFPGRNVTFLICSNVSVALEPFRGLSVSLAPGHPAVDLYSLAECDAIIGSPSTFSEWASFYGCVPRYQHRLKDYLRRSIPWQGVALQDFKVHTSGFGRCAKEHFVSLRK